MVFAAAVSRSFLAGPAGHEVIKAMLQVEKLVALSGQSFILMTGHISLLAALFDFVTYSDTSKTMKLFFFTFLMKVKWFHHVIEEES